MKKIIVILFLLVSISVIVNEKENILIPKDAIRFRIIANSDSMEDQELKLTIKNDVEKELFTLLKGAETIDEARNRINDNINSIKKIVDK